ncbi:hypothetical protein Strop_0549 [Salinispora tropica CNB-440]|uniref:Uncharacterized protein n=1 Tax=Salinispora tropica (strain ATCC BAA-916 / DSM 44818 / JCM 13857 / NBRC 105044 / CNB-440) TaxID=369723 RepID=A4X2D2_SALTO|nr:hypothetical protein Strop_0549 [Salinispora tropica CNB-440]
MPLRPVAGLAEYKSRWRWAWAIWLAVVAASFAVMEGLALVRRRPGDTLSEATRHWIKAKKGRGLSRGEWGLIAALGAFLIWFLPHITLEIW